MPAIFSTLTALEAELHEMGTLTSEYWEKQVHPVPASRVVDRIGFLVDRCTGKTIVHIGCDGPLDAVLRKAATRCYGIDKTAMDRPDYARVDLDQLAGADTMPHWALIDLIVCGEVVEHLSNPGYFLETLKKQYPVPVVLTVPNAFSLAGQAWLVKRGRENVNKDHVCYYSYTTLKELLRRAGYTLTEHYWYGGKPYVSEGLIVVAKPVTR